MKWYSLKSILYSRRLYLLPNFLWFVWNNLLLCIYILKGKSSPEAQPWARRDVWHFTQSVGPGSYDWWAHLWILIPSLHLSSRQEREPLGICNIMPPIQISAMQWTNRSNICSEWLLILMSLIPCSGQPLQRSQGPSISPHPDE